MMHERRLTKGLTGDYTRPVIEQRHVPSPQQIGDPVLVGRGAMGEPVYAVQMEMNYLTIWRLKWPGSAIFEHGSFISLIGQCNSIEQSRRRSGAQYAAPEWSRYEKPGEPGVSVWGITWLCKRCRDEGTRSGSHRTPLPARHSEWHARHDAHQETPC